MSFLLDAEITKQEMIGPGHYRLNLLAPDIAAAARPGQFLQVRCGSTLDPFLRRPISINAVDRENGEVALFYRVAGRGTALLTQKAQGEPVSLLGPLGRGFSLPKSQARVAVVSGGIGIAPLYFLLLELAVFGVSADVFLGAATAGQLFFTKEIKGLGHRVEPATDDGSAGYHGLVTDLFAENMARSSEYAMIYGCGPGGMQRRLAEIIKEFGVSGELSLEERMGCGVGACLSCVCKTGSEGSIQYRRVCTEGPVFPAGEVVWA
ncbi:MAG: dihydroorotate dehydrogenase electron transfer subunit [Desulfotomaculaceae bacterium]|nr:dihydroorotate dehydrogenase electron transfer subunit [Desulfotomaculaceae bacterium]